VPFRFGVEQPSSANKRRQGLWVPAFAGTTKLKSPQDSLVRGAIVKVLDRR
jgi:hypothetical protein